MAATEVRAPGRRSYGTGSLYVRADAGGREAWYGRWRDDGRQIMRVVGPVRVKGSADGLTRQQAERALRDLIVAARPASGPRTALPFDTLADRYLTHLEALGRKPSTVQDVRGHLRHWLRPHFDGRTVDRITAEDVDRLVQAMRDGRRPSGLARSKPAAPKTIRNVIGNLSAILAYAERKGWARGNPARAVDLPAVTSHEEIRWLEPAEVHALAASAVPGPWQRLDQALYVAAAMTGLREGELIALRWRDVDWTAGAIRVRRSHVRGVDGVPKSRRSVRTVPMADDVARALEAIAPATADDDALVFPDPMDGLELRPAALLRRMRKALKAAGLEETHRFHDLRHTFGTRMAARGVPMRTLQEWMGHKDIATTQRYADYAPRHDERQIVQAAFAASPEFGGSSTAGTGRVQAKAI